MREKSKIKIVLSLLIAVSFILPMSSVMAGPTLSRDIVKADVPNATPGKGVAGFWQGTPGSTSPLVSLAPGPYPVDITQISIGGIDHKTGDIVKQKTYKLDVDACRTQFAQEDPFCQGQCADVKLFINVFKQRIIPGNASKRTVLYTENFEDPCEITENWATIDMPVWGDNGALDTWTWSNKRYCSASHSMHSTSFAEYLPNQYDILELNFGGTGLNVSGFDNVEVSWCQFVKGDMGTYLQDYGFFEWWNGTAGAWQKAGVSYYDSGGVTQTITVNISLDALDPSDDFVMFRWTWVSDAIFCYEGWYIDDVKVTGIVGSLKDVTTWDFVMDSYSNPTMIPGECITYVFNQSWVATTGKYRICAWLQTLDEYHFSSTEYDNPYCIYIDVGDILDFEIDCDTKIDDPISPAWDGDDLNVSIDVCNVGTLDATNVQVEFKVQRGFTAITGYNGFNLNKNNATTGLIPGRLMVNTFKQWVRGTSGTYPWGTMAGNIRGYEHYTTYNHTEGNKSLANFQEIAFPYRYWNYQSPNDYARGPVAYVKADKDLGWKVTCDFTFSIGAGDNLRLGIWDYNGTGWGYSYNWNGPAYIPWTPFEIPISDWITLLLPHWTAASGYALYVYHTKSSTAPAPIDNQNPANPENDKWSGWMLDNLVYSQLVALPEVVYSQIVVVPYLNITNCTTVEFSWPNMTVGRYVYSFSILTPDAVTSNNLCRQGYEVYNTEVCAEEMACVDHTGQGLGHWVEEACCGGYFWAGDPVTTLYGINWSDCLYLRNATGGLTFDMTDSSDACIDFDTWFQMKDTGDYGLVQYSDDGGIHWWDLNTPYTGNSSTYMGADTFGFFHDSYCVGYTTADMQFRFLFVSNATGVARGWILDNIALSNDTGYVFGPNPALNFDKFYRTELQDGCWWFTPDLFGYTPGWGNFDPLYLQYPQQLYHSTQNSSLVWTLNIPDVWFGALHYWEVRDLDVNDTVFLEISTDGGATWAHLENMTGFFNGWATNNIEAYTNVPQVLVRWRMLAIDQDDGVFTPYYGFDVEDPCFIGMADHNAPVTQLQMTGTFDETYHYYTSAVKMKLTATDDITGIAHTYYKLDGVTKEYTGIVTINTDGDHTFCYWSVDNEGNIEAEKCVPSFRIDLTGPTVTITGPATGALYIMGNQILPLKSGKTIFLFGGIPVTASASSTEAPIQVVRFYLDDVLLNEDSTSPYGATLSAKHNGPAVIKVTARDVLGHEASATLNIDNYIKLL